MAAAEYVIELKGPVDLKLFDPNVAHDEIDEDPPPPVDFMNPDRRLYQGADFPTYLIRDQPPGEVFVSGLVTSDLAYAQTGPHGYETIPARDTFEDALIDLLRADVERLLGRE